MVQVLQLHSQSLPPVESASVEPNSNKALRVFSTDGLWQFGVICVVVWTKG